VPQCKYHQYCGRDVEDNSADGLCILHSIDPAKNADAFAEALAAHRERNRNNFIRFVFPRKADFSGITFHRLARFDGTTFTQGARFVGATFSKGAFFMGATFGEEVAPHLVGMAANFSGAAFRRLTLSRRRLA
jgi:uncharacterized protein YjbI with pentapeptide repeats